MNDVEDTTLVGLSDDFSILRRLAKKVDAVYESAAKDTKFPLMKFLDGDTSSLPMAPPSSRNMRAAAPVAMESTGSTGAFGRWELDFRRQFWSYACRYGGAQCRSIGSVASWKSTSNKK